MTCKIPIILIVSKDLKIYLFTSKNHITVFTIDYFIACSIIYNEIEYTQTKKAFQTYTYKKENCFQSWSRHM